MGLRDFNNQWAGARHFVALLLSVALRYCDATFSFLMAHPREEPLPFFSLYCLHNLSVVSYGTSLALVRHVNIYA